MGVASESAGSGQEAGYSIKLSLTPFRPDVHCRTKNDLLTSSLKLRLESGAESQSAKLIKSRKQPPKKDGLSCIKKTRQLRYG